MDNTGTEVRKQGIESCRYFGEQLSRHREQLKKKNILGGSTFLNENVIAGA